MRCLLLSLVFYLGLTLLIKVLAYLYNKYRCYKLHIEVKAALPYGYSDMNYISVRKRGKCIHSIETDSSDYYEEVETLKGKFNTKDVRYLK